MNRRIFLKLLGLSPVAPSVLMANAVRQSTIPDEQSEAIVSTMAPPDDTGKRYYFDYENGDDENDGLTWETARKRYWRFF